VCLSRADLVGCGDSLMGRFGTVDQTTLVLFLHWMHSAVSSKSAIAETYETTGIGGSFFIHNNFDKDV